MSREQRATPVGLSVDHISAQLRRMLSHWLHPGYWLIALWIVMFYKEAETISPLVFDVTVKMYSTVLFLLLLIPVLFFPAGVVRSGHPSRLSWILPAVAGCLIVWALSFLAQNFGRFGYHVNSSDVLMIGALFGSLTLCGWILVGRMITTRRQWLFLGLSWAVISLAWVVPLRNFPLDGDRSDMLPLIVSAGKTWLAGQTPYQWHEVGTHRLPLTYLPMMWLPYVPFAMLDVDPRWIMIPAQLGMLLVHWIAFRQQLSTPWWDYLLWLALNPLLFIRHEIYVYLFWAFVAATLLCMLRQWWLPASVMWGLLLVSQQTLWIVFPFYIAFLLWNTGRRNALRCGLIAAFIALLIAAPFAVGSPVGFAEGLDFLRHVAVEIPKANWEQVAGWATGFSFVPIIYLIGFSRYLEPLQVITVAVLFAVMVLRRPNLAGTLQLMSVTLLLTLLLNAPGWTYMYGSLLLFVAFAGLARGSLLSPTPPLQAERPVSGDRSSPRWPTSASL